MTSLAISQRDRAALGLQRAIGRLTSPLWVPLAWAWMRGFARWRLEASGTLRREFQSLLQESSAPLLVCANHLTLVDSLLVAWSLGSPAQYLRRWRFFPWNTPERTIFARRWWSRALVYSMKCVPIPRGGDRDEVVRVLGRVTHLLAAGEPVLLFPEGGRSRSGRVDVGSAAWGVGRIVKALPGCRVLCVYLRGAGQTTWSDLPARGESFRVRYATIEPKSDLSGVRGSLEISRQIVATLARLEAEAAR